MMHHPRSHPTPFSYPNMSLCALYEPSSDFQSRDAFWRGQCGMYPVCSWSCALHASFHTHLGRKAQKMCNTTFLGIDRAAFWIASPVEVKEWCDWAVAVHQCYEGQTYNVRTIT